MDIIFKIMKGHLLRGLKMLFFTCACFGMAMIFIQEMCKQNYIAMGLAFVGFCVMLCFYDKASLDFDKGLRNVDERETGSDNERTL